MTALPQPQQREPLRLTLGQWHNHRITTTDIRGERTERWVKKLAHTGQLSQFAYGTKTPSEWNRRDLQVCIICTRQTGVFAIDVDDAAEYASTELARYASREQAISERGDRYHILVDARQVPPDLWPGQGEIRGANGLHAADIKSNGWVPVPGSRHYSDELYKPVLHDGKTRITPCTPQILTAITAGRQQAPSAQVSGHGNGGGHDGEIAAQVLGWVRQGMAKEAVYAEWLKIATPRDPAWPFERGDFERHHRTALAKVAATPAPELPADQMEWAESTMSTPNTPPWAAGAPVTCAQAEAVYRRWLHDNDPVPTRIVLAAYTANMFLPGDPVWVMLVGGSGIGKTERITPISALPGVVMVSTLTGEAALLSASPKRERAKNATGGVLRQIGEHGVLVVKDFTSVLSMSRDRRAEVVAAMREVYDGRWDRHYGTDGGQVLTWQGHCGFIAGCTTAIDSAHAVLDAMGTRFLFVRLPDADPIKIGRSALAHAGHETQMRAELAQVTMGLLANLGRPHEIHEGVSEWLAALASLASQARSPVEHDNFGNIALVLDAEAPTRIVKQLGQLWKACGMLGLGEAESWQAVRRAGLDSIPKLRRAVIEYLGDPRQMGSWQPTTDIAQAVKHPSRTTLRTLEDLTAHGIVTRNVTQLGPDRRTYSWALSAQALTWWNALHR